MTVRRARPEEMSSAFDIRQKVFMIEQGISKADEFDGRDDEAVHLIAFDGATPVGTARLFLSDGIGKIGRVAVLKSHRGTGQGQALIHAAMSELKKMGAHTAKLGAQTHAMGFYQAMGFTAFGAEYLDAGIPHRDMTCAL